MSSLWAATQVAVYHFLSENHGFRLEVQSLIPHASYLVENQLVSCRRSRSDGTKRTASSAKNREAIHEPDTLNISVGNMGEASLKSSILSIDFLLLEFKSSFRCTFHLLTKSPSQG